MLSLTQVALTLPTSCNLQDLATQMQCSLRELRAYLVRQGKPLEFDELREAMAEDHDLTQGSLLLANQGSELLDEAHTRARRHAVRHNQTYRLDVPETPYLITFWGDWHVGEAGTNHQLLKQDATLIAELKAQLGNSHVLIGMGDYIGGYMRSKTPSNNAQVLSPAEQREAAVSLLELTRPDLIIQGDHDEWHTRMDTEHEWLQELCAREELHYAQWGAGLELVGPDKQLTRVLARHRFDGSRKSNPFTPQVNLHTQWGPADIVAVAHYHSNPGISMQRSTRIKEGSFHAVQSGTYKVFDDYGKKLGVGNGEYGVPSILVIPEEGELIQLPDLREALKTARAVCN